MSNVSLEAFLKECINDLEIENEIQIYNFKTSNETYIIDNSNNNSFYIIHEEDESRLIVNWKEMKWLNNSDINYIEDSVYSEDKINNTENAIKFCLKNPKWKLSIQQHKILGID